MTHYPNRWKRLRNLSQYREMDDDEFFEAMRERDAGIAEKEDSSSSVYEGFSPTAYKEFQDRVEKKLEELSKDYDLSDMKANDLEVVNAMCRAFVTLEDLQQRYFTLTQGDFSENFDSVKALMELINKVNSDISKAQNDLNISRNRRSRDKDASVVSALEELKKKAKDYYEKVMMYVYCPKCNMLLGTTWFLYPDEDNSLSFTCNRSYDNDEGGKIVCGHKFTVTSKELKKKKGTNHPEEFRF